MKPVVEFVFSIIRNSGTACQLAVRKLRQLGHVLLAMGLVLMPIASQAGNLTLSNAPLFLGTTVEPNITFVSDDSGSMDWDITILGNQGRFTIRGQTRTRTYSYTMCDKGSSSSCNSGGGKWDNTYAYTSGNGGVLPSEEAVIAQWGSAPYGVWRARFSGYNVQYYNPETTYTPWPGVDNTGTVFGNIDPDNAPLDPYNPSGLRADLDKDFSYRSYRVPRPFSSGRTTLDVNNYYPARYYLWTDSDNDGVVDFDDAHTRIEIRVGNGPFVHTSGNRSDCLDSLACTYAEEMQNYANWFSYYRRREMAAKNAIGKFAGGAINVRLAYATMHNNTKGLGANNIGIASMNIDPNSGNKKTLLDGLYKTQSANGTPLRITLRDTGRYYECASGNIFGASGSNCPILPAASGGACQQNFAVLMTDGYWNGSNPGVANTDVDGPGSFDGPPYADNFSDTLADVAMHYYERDLNTTLANRVPITPGIDEANHQHMVTYTVAFGVEGTLDPSDTKTPGIPSDTDPTDASFVGWPSPTTSNLTRLDDMWHAAYNGRGEYLNATDPNDLTNKLNNALASIIDRTGSASAVALNSGTLSTNSKVYQARFDSGGWSGQLLAIPINTNGTLGATLWDAGDLLKSQATRQIISWNTSTNAGTPFTWSGIGSAQRTELDKNPGTGVPDGLGVARLDFLRGNHSNEISNGGSFRSRINSAVLGDIVSSGPVFVGMPPFAYPDSLNPGYLSFQGANAARTEIVYVGGNDGMLHGFDANTGEEKIAYVPGYVYKSLRELTDPSYSHRYFVDGTPTVADVYYGGAWHTVLVGSMRAGSQGLFALDITSPSAFSETNAASLALWEYTDANDSDLGYTFSRPAVTKMRNGKWAAIFGNGYNNTENDGNPSASGDAVLYIVDIETGVLIKKISTLHGKATSIGGTTPNGLSTPTIVDQEGDYVADFILAGDLQGNMWKFDVRDNSPANWFVVTDGTNPEPLFTATDAGGVPQPITVRPEVSEHPDGKDGYMVYFGTGKYIESGDNTSAGAQVNTFYGIWDQMGTTTGPHTTVSKTDLQVQTLTEIPGPPDLRTITDNPITAWGTAGGQHMGWKVDLPAAAEKNVTNPILIGDRVLFTTLIPDDTPCGFGGTGFVMELDFQNGGPPDSAVFDTNGDGVIDSSDNSGGAVVVGFNPNIGMLPDPAILNPGAGSGGGPPPPMYKIFSGSTGAVSTVSNPPGTAPFRRRSWRQLR